MRVLLALGLFLYFQSSWAIEVNESNSKALGYDIKVEIPNEDEPSFLRIKIVFPEEIEDFYKYAYSSAVYSKKGRTLLSYRPESGNVYSGENKYVYIVAHKEVLKCLSVINIYFDRRDRSLHPPQKHVSINLMSFIETPNKECKGKVSASNFY